MKLIASLLIAAALVAPALSNAAEPAAPAPAAESLEAMRKRARQRLIGAAALRQVRPELMRLERAHACFLRRCWRWIAS